MRDDNRYPCEADQPEEVASAPRRATSYQQPGLRRLHEVSGDVREGWEVDKVDGVNAIISIPISYQAEKWIASKSTVYVICVIPAGILSPLKEVSTIFGNPSSTRYFLFSMIS